MNTDLRKKTKNDLEKDFFKLMKKAGFRKTIENVRKHGDIKVASTTKKGETIWCQKQTIKLKSFSHKIY